MQEKLKKLGFEFRIENNQIILKNTFTNLEYKFNNLDQVDYFLQGFGSCQEQLPNHVTIQQEWRQGTPGCICEHVVIQNKTIALLRMPSMGPCSSIDTKVYSNTPSYWYGTPVRTKA